MRKAVVDVGSGSVVLLVAESGPDGWHAVVETSRVTLLGENLKRTGRIDPARAAETLRAVRDAFDIAYEHGVTEAQAVGTAALRLAQNSTEFLAAANDQATPVSVITGELEAHLAYLAVVNDPALRGQQRLTILDPGGQSTELIQASRDSGDWRKTFSHSFGIGTLQLRTEVLPQETPNPGEILTASSWIDDAIGTKVNPGDVGTLVCLGAPATDLVCIRNRWTTWDAAKVHGETLDYEEVGKAVGWLMRMSDAEREQVPGVQAGRGSTSHLAALILERFMNALAAPECRVSTRGWRWGLLDQA